MADTVTTAGGLKVASGVGLAWLAAQVRALVSRGYPAFVRRQDASVEFVRSDSGWSAVSEGNSPTWAADLTSVLNETEET